MKRFLFLSLLILLAVSGLKAQETTVRKSEIIETYKGRQHYIHFMEQGQTLHAISKAYGVTIEEIKNSNPDMPEVLRANEVIMVPVMGNAAAVPTEKPKEQQVVKPAQEKPVQVKQGGTEHIIAPKETWYALSRQYNIPVKELIAANPGTDTLRIGMKVFIPEPKQAEAKPGYKLYKVQPQETLYGISLAYGITVEELVRINPGLENGLRAGEEIYVPESPQQTAVKQDPPAKTGDGYIRHQVERKETLYSIARHYGVEMADILKANPGLGATLKKNDILLIPRPGSVTAKKENETPRVDSVVLGRPVFEEARPAPFSGNADCRPGAAEKRVFNLALLIPFSLEEADSVYTGDPMRLKQPSEYRSLDFIQFYEGALIALDDAAERGVDVKVHVYDADAGEGLTKTRRILANPEMQKMDLIIGPLFAKGFETVASFAAKNKIPVINPLSQRSGIIQNNEWVVKVQPSNSAGYDNAARTIVRQYSGANFVVMRRNGTENALMAEAFLNSLRRHAGNPAAVQEVNYSKEQDAGLTARLKAGQPNVLFMLTGDKALIPALMRRMNDVREKYDLTVVGLTDWEDMEMDINYLQNVNAHFFTPWFVDYTRPEVLRFVEKFRERFVSEPELSRYAFLGYDLTAYFLDALSTFGPGFLNCVPDFKRQGLSNDFRFFKQEGGGYENSSLSVYRLNNFKREVVKGTE